MPAFQCSDCRRWVQPKHALNHNCARDKLIDECKADIEEISKRLAEMPHPQNLLITSALKNLEKALEDLNAFRET